MVPAPTSWSLDADVDSGKAANLWLGMSKVVVLDALGKPRDKGTRKKGGVMVERWVYRRIVIGRTGLRSINTRVSGNVSVLQNLRFREIVEIEFVNDAVTSVDITRREADLSPGAISERL